MRVPAPLRHRAFRWLFTARTAAQFGNAVAPIAVAYAVLDLTGSLTALGAVVAARSLAHVAVLLLGGVLADRWPRALVLTSAQLAAAATQACAAVMVLSGSATVALLVGLSVINGAAAAVAFPASAALLPQTVPSGLLQQANAVSRLGVNTAMVAGASAGGALVAFTGPGWGLLVDAVGFAVAGACFACTGGVGPTTVTTTGPGVRTTGRAGVTRDLVQGWREFVSRQWVWVVAAQFCVVNAAWVGGAGVLGPAAADVSIGRAGWGLALAATGAGLAAGAVLAVFWRPVRALGIGVAGCVLVAVPLVVLALRPDLVLLCAATFLAGVAREQFAVAWDMSLQQNVPADRLARVYSLDALGSYVAIPVAQVVIGPVAQRAGAQAALLGCAALVFLATSAALASPQVRELHRRAAILQETHA